MLGNAFVMKNPGGYELLLLDLNYEATKQGPFHDITHIKSYLDRMVRTLYLTIDSSVPETDRNLFDQYSPLNREPVRTH